jgi:hypothetical protein
MTMTQDFAYLLAAIVVVAVLSQTGFIASALLMRLIRLLRAIFNLGF